MESTDELPVKQEQELSVSSKNLLSSTHTHSGKCNHSSQKIAEIEKTLCCTENNSLEKENLENGEENVITAYDVEEAMKDVIDPELGINIVDLGLVYGITLDETGKATLDMTLTSPACPLTDVIETQTRYVLSNLVEEVEINWVWLPPWGPEQITDDGKDQLRALGFNL